jgi:hypothetical protein
MRSNESGAAGDESAWHYDVSSPFLRSKIPSGGEWLQDTPRGRG